MTEERMTREEALDLIAKRMAFSEKDVAVCRAALDALTARAAEDAGEVVVATGLYSYFNGDVITSVEAQTVLVRFDPMAHGAKELDGQRVSVILRATGGKP